MTRQGDARAREVREITQELQNGDRILETLCLRLRLIMSYSLTQDLF